MNENKMMKQLYTPFKVVLCLVCCILVPWVGKAQNVTVDASIDSIRRYIGEQARIKLEVSCDAEQKVQMPVFKDILVDGVEIVDVAKADTQYLNSGKRMMITQEYTVTAFDSATYHIPPFEVMVDGQPYYSKDLALMAYLVDLGEMNPDSTYTLYGVKPIMESKYLIMDYVKVAGKPALSLLLLWLIWYLVVRLLKNKGLVRVVKAEPKLPPHEQAMREIERIKAEKTWQKGDPKGYYTELTEVLRVYIKQRFGFNALEKTSSEIIDFLQENDDPEARKDLKQLFETADLVKFAKYAPMLNENDLNLVTAIDFVNRTKVDAPVDEKPEPVKITVEERLSGRIRIGLITGIVVLAVLVLALVFYAVRDICDMFF